MSDRTQDGDLDAELMAFAQRCRRARAQEEAAPAAASDVEFVEAVDEADGDPPAARPLQAVVVEEVDPAAPRRIGEIPPSATGAEMPSDADSYAIKRVAELMAIAAATPTREPSPMTELQAQEAARINLDALEKGRKSKTSGSKPKHGS